MKSGYSSRKNTFVMTVLTALGLASGCSDPLQNLANTEASDLTDVALIRKRAIKVMASSQPSMV